MPKSEMKAYVMKRYVMALLLGLALALSIPKTIAFADTPVIVAPRLDIRTVALSEYFTLKNCPLLPYVSDFITAADKYNVDYRLLPAISIHESTCGKRFPADTNNPFGWNSAKGPKGRFASIPVAIDYITKQLANASPYAGKSIRTKLSYYCPSPSYPAETMSYMLFFSKEPIK